MNSLDKAIKAVDASSNSLYLMDLENSADLIISYSEQIKFLKQKIAEQEKRFNKQRNEIMKLDLSAEDKVRLKNIVSKKNQSY